MSIYTDEEQARRAMSDTGLNWQRKKLIKELVAAGADPLHPKRSMDPRAEVVADIDRILRHRANKRAADALMQDPAWQKTWPVTVKRIAQEMLDAHDEHCGNARGALREIVHGKPRENVRSVEETFDAWNDRYDILKYICEAAGEHNDFGVIAALRRVFEDRKEPLYGWTNMAEIGEPPVPKDPAEKKRADDRLERFFQVWDDLSVVVRGFPSRKEKRS